MTNEIIRVVRLKDGTLYVPPDARRDIGERASWIYSRFVAELVAEETGGTVEVVS
jgi:hypothetical protein